MRCAPAAPNKLNALMALGPRAWSALRLALSRALARRRGRAATPRGLPGRRRTRPSTPCRRDRRLHGLLHLGHHATNIGRQFRPDNPLLPNYKWVPIGYHGRSIEHRRLGPAVPAAARPDHAAGRQAPVVGPCKRLDHELELGVFVGTGNAAGEPIPIDEAEDARVRPAACSTTGRPATSRPGNTSRSGPFLSKNFASTISPWIVTLEALAPYPRAVRAARGRPAAAALPGSTRRTGAPAPSTSSWRCCCRPRRCAQRWPAGAPITLTNYRHAYWTIAQMVAHHTVNGCNLQPGDLFGSGTLSGPTLDQAGATDRADHRRQEPDPAAQRRNAQLAGGRRRSRCCAAGARRPGAARIGFGECMGTVLPARPLS